MDTQVNTHVASVSKIKMAIALLFLGGAALAASAAGGVAGRGGGSSLNPDLFIRGMKFYTTGYEEGKGGPGYSWNNDLLTIYYYNKGKKPVTKPFKIGIRFELPPYTGGGNTVGWLTTTGAAFGPGYSGGFDGFTLMPADQESKWLYTVPVESVGGDSPDFYKNLNKYNLNPGEWGQVRVYVPTYFKQMLSAGQFSIRAQVDYEKGLSKGVIKESKENNNSKNLVVKKSQLTTLEQDSCENPNNPAFSYDICENQGKPFACLDKFTETFKGCAETEAECDGFNGVNLACSVGDMPQPNFQSITIEIGDWSTTTYASMFKGAGNVVLEYPAEYKDEFKMVHFDAVVDNMDSSTKLGLYVTPENATVYYPNESNENYAQFVVPEAVWGTPGMLASSFGETADTIKMHLLLDNGDDGYAGMPNNQLDDALLIELKSEYAPEPSTLTIEKGYLGDETFIQGTQTAGRYKFVVEGDETVCIDKLAIKHNLSNNGSYKGIASEYAGINVYDDEMGGQYLGKLDQFVSVDYAGNNMSEGAIDFETPYCPSPGMTNVLRFEIEGAMYNAAQSIMFWMEPMHIVYTGSQTGESNELIDLDEGNTYLFTKTYEGFDLGGPEPGGNATTTSPFECVFPECNAPSSTSEATLIYTVDKIKQNVDEYYMVAGDEYQVAMIYLEAEGADLKVEDLPVAFQTGLNEFQMDNTYYVYKILDGSTGEPLGQEIGWGDTGGSQVLFESINIHVEKGSKRKFVVVVQTNAHDLLHTPNINSTLPSNLDTSLKVKPGLANAMQVKDMETFANLSSDAITMEDNGSGAGHVALVEPTVISTFGGGTLVGGQQTIFSFEVTAHNPWNKTFNGEMLDMYLLTLDLELYTDLDISPSSSSHISNVELCRVDIGECIDLNTMDMGGDLIQLYVPGTWGPEANFLTLKDVHGSFKHISHGEHVQYALRATVAGPTDKFLQVAFNNLDDEGFIWGYDLQNNEDPKLGNPNSVFHQGLKPMWPDSNWPKVVGGALDGN